MTATLTKPEPATPPATSAPAPATVTTSTTNQLPGGSSNSRWTPLQLTVLGVIAAVFVATLILVAATAAF